MLIKTTDAPTQLPPCATKSTKDSRTDPRKLGFMRFIEISYAITIVLAMFSLIFVSKDEYVLTATDYENFISLVLKSIALWLIIKRKKALLFFLPIACLAELAFDFVFFVIISQANIFAYFFMETGLIVTMIYVLTSRRMKNVMTMPFSSEEKRNALESEQHFWNPRSKAFWRNILIYFCLFSVVGHWMEAGYGLLIRYGIMPGTYDPNSQIWSDWLYPFMVYGIGFCVCGIVLFPLKMQLEKNLKGMLAPFIASFLINTLACAAIELVLGLTQNADLQLWDYSNMFMNFMGQICLVNSLLFGSVATLMTWIIYPGLEKILGKLPREGGIVLFIAVIVLFALLICLYYLNGNASQLLRSAGVSESTITQLESEYDAYND